MSEISLEADPLKREQIRKFAFFVREFFGLEETKYVNVIEFLEFDLPRKMTSFSYDIMDSNMMDNTHGFAKPDHEYICIREDVYEGACKGLGRDRATIIHEIGHLFLHTSDRIRYPRAGGKIATYKDPEWQAKAFAGEFLVASHLMENFKTVEEVADGFGVSTMSAKFQLKQYEEASIIKRGQIKDLTSQ